MSIKTKFYELPVELPSDQELFAIGDVHGCASQLEEVLAVAKSIPRLEGKKRSIIFIGDLMDRGPENLRAIDLASQAGRFSNSDDQLYCCGNHDIMFRAMFQNDQIAYRYRKIWMLNGGYQPNQEISKKYGGFASLLDLKNKILHQLPPEVVQMYTDMKSHVRIGPLLFVHAGIHPQIEQERFLSRAWDIDIQDLNEDEHWSWIRNPFLTHKTTNGWDGSFVIHGHTIRDYDPAKDVKKGINERWRLNLDTGCFSTGKLTMAHIIGNQVKLYSTYNS